MALIGDRALHIMTSICTRMPIPKDRCLSCFHQLYKDQPSKEIVLTSFTMWYMVLIAFSSSMLQTYTNPSSINQRQL